MSADYMPNGYTTLLHPGCYHGRNVQDNVTIQVHFRLRRAAQTDCENTVYRAHFSARITLEDRPLVLIAKATFPRPAHAAVDYGGLQSNRGLLQTGRLVLHEMFPPNGTLNPF